LRRDDAVSFDFGPDGVSLAVAGRGGAWLERLDGSTESGKPIVPRACQAVRFSPDGQHLALLDGDGQLSLWSFAEAQERPLGRARHGVTFSPDGRRIAAFGESAAQVWDVARGDMVATIPLVAAHLLFTPDGRTIVTAGDEIHLWQADTGRELLNLGAYSPGGVNDVAVSPDGTRLAVGGGYRDEHQGVWVWLAPKLSAELEGDLDKGDRDAVQE
jgi:WD40 repeat protein